MTPRSIWTETDAMVGSAKIRFVLWMTIYVADLGHSVSKLAFFSVLASSMFLKGSAHFSLIPRGWLLLLLAALAVWGVWGTG